MHTLKKNRIARFAVLLLVLTLMTSCFVGGTFAKYTSTAVATDTVTVAKWDVKLDGAAFSDTAVFDFTSTWTDSDGSAEEDVVSKKLAPGTKGAFNLVVSNDSEVNARYKIEFDFSALAALGLTYTYKVDGVASDAATIANWNPIDMNGDHTVTVEWAWPFEAGRDAADTTLGEAAANFDVTATITAEQVD